MLQFNHFNQNSIEKKYLSMKIIMGPFQLTFTGTLISWL